jgi:SAM-dependent methyltransferase
MSGPTPVYFKDIWALGPQENTGMDCPGRFPNGFMNRVMDKWGKGKADKLMLFSGTFHEPGWVTVDIRPKMEPTVVANCEDLPFPAASFDLVILDPPYSKEEARDLYELPYVHMGKALNEAARVLRPGGTMCLLHRVIPECWRGMSKDFRQLQIIAIVGMFFATSNSSIRALTVWRKRNDMTAFFEPAEQSVEVD